MFMLQRSTAKMIGYRNSGKALTFGDIIPGNLTLTEVASFERACGDESRLILNVVSDVDANPLAGFDGAIHCRFIFIDSRNIVEQGGVKVPAWPTVTLK